MAGAGGIAAHARDCGWSASVRSTRDARSDRESITSTGRPHCPGKPVWRGFAADCPLIGCPALWTCSLPKSFPPRRSLSVKHRAATVDPELSAPGIGFRSHGLCLRKEAEFYMVNCAHSHAAHITLSMPAPPRMLRTPRIETFAPLIRAHLIRTVSLEERRSGFGTR